MPSKCFNCKEAGHQARDCPLPPIAGRGEGKRGRSPVHIAGFARGARRRRASHSCRRASSADTASARSVSTDRDPSVPPVYEPPTPDHPGDGFADAPAVDARVEQGAHGAPVDAPGLGAHAAPGGAGIAVDNDAAGAAADAAPDAVDAGASERPHLVPRSLLWRVQAPPASPRTLARTSLLEMVVVPHTPAIQAAEDALSLALVLGTRPPVSPAMVRDLLGEYFGIADNLVAVHRTKPDDFRFSRPEDQEMVLSTPWPAAAPFALRWCRWSRLFMASAGAFRYRVLVGMKGIPTHARSSDTAQTILGSSSAWVEITNPDALVDPDDERELFVAAWCAHPDMAIPEPEEEHDGGSPLYLRPWEIIHDEVPALRYLLRLRIVEFQDWHTPPPSSDDEMYNAGDDDEDRDNSNYNGFHPGFSGDGSRSRPRTTRFGRDSDPALGKGSGPAFRARGSRRAIQASWDGPDLVLGPSFGCLEDGDKEVAHAVDLCLSGPEDCSSGQSSPRPTIVMEQAACLSSPSAPMEVVHELVVAVADDDHVTVGAHDGDDEPMPVHAFIDSFKKTLPQPVLSTPILRVTKLARVWSTTTSSSPREAQG
ncbi:unnamed protein product [Miscanthus lutarioriparius]|uniref:CCHC-type domain-containing protein n=1 Tax=Miscanthus lutarioriparius TaxID=422564 RepID=A0A811PT57_9POAL|nr:unnamed protein product [Miscanthus lutarioriparius]